MYNIVLRYFYQPIGALICWMFKGFKGNIKNEFNDENKFRNSIVGVFVFSGVVILIGFFKS